MADLRDYQTQNQQVGSRAGAAIDEGLRSYMLRVYNLMALGLGIILMLLSLAINGAAYLVRDFARAEAV